MKRLLAVLGMSALFAGSLVTGSPPMASAGVPAPPSFSDYFDSVQVSVKGTYVPLVGSNACVGDSVFVLWYAAGSAPDFVWTVDQIDPIGYTAAATTVNGTFRPVVGDFDSDGCDDIFWHAPGLAGDFVWFGRGDGTFTSQSRVINGSYQPVVSDLDQDGTVDIFWYAPGTAPESVWTGRRNRTFARADAPSVDGTYRVASLGPVIMFHKPGPGQDFIWVGVQPGATAPDDQFLVSINGSYQPIWTSDGIFLYAASPAGSFFANGLNADGTLATTPGTITGRFTVGIRSPKVLDLLVWHAPRPAASYLWTYGPLRAPRAARSFGAQVDTPALPFAR